jgi:hypothetical protein
MQALLACAMLTQTLTTSPTQARVPTNAPLSHLHTQTHDTHEWCTRTHTHTRTRTHTHCNPLGGVCRALQPAQKHRARLAVLGRFDPFLCRALLAFGSVTACKRAREQEQRVADTSSQPPPPPASQNRMRLVAR